MDFAIRFYVLVFFDDDGGGDGALVRVSTNQMQY